MVDCLLAENRVISLPFQPLVLFRCADYSSHIGQKVLRARGAMFGKDTGVRRKALNPHGYIEDLGFVLL